MHDILQSIWLSMTVNEMLAFALSVVMVVLNIRRSHWAWLFAILSSAYYAVVFHGALMYGNMGLQFVFIGVSLWGWYQWLRGGSANAPLVVGRLDAAGWAVSAAGWLVGFVLLALFLKNFTETDVPYIDGFLTAGSLLGQLLLSRKKVENWLIWIVVNVLYVGLFLYKSLFPSAFLYALFIVMAIIGWRVWNKAAPQRASPLATA